jgi:hypothetical protein
VDSKRGFNTAINVTIKSASVCAARGAFKFVTDLIKVPVCPVAHGCGFTVLAAA